MVRGHGGTILAAGNQRERNTRSRISATAVEQILPLFSSLEFPRWAGPLVFIDPESAFIAADGSPEPALANSRPSLPFILLPKIEPFDQRAFRRLVGMGMSDFVLTTCDPRPWLARLASLRPTRVSWRPRQRQTGSPAQPAQQTTSRRRRHHRAPTRTHRAQDEQAQALAIAVTTLLTTRRRAQNLAPS